MCSAFELPMPLAKSVAGPLMETLKWVDPVDVGYPHYD